MPSAYDSGPGGHAARSWHAPFAFVCPPPSSERGDKRQDPEQGQLDHSSKALFSPACIGRSFDKLDKPWQIQPFGRGVLGWTDFEDEWESWSVYREAVVALMVLQTRSYIRCIAVDEPRNTSNPKPSTLKYNYIYSRSSMCTYQFTHAHQMH